MNRRIVMSSLSIFASAALVAGATFAFFSDTETSSGNVLAAGAIDLKIDNESFLNGVLQNGQGGTANTTWSLRDITNELFFNFTDLKPGDEGEDTISLHVDNNDAWLCMDFAVTADDDVSCTDPELAVEDEGECDDGVGPPNEGDGDPLDGELGDALEFVFWVDDGDNVLEQDGEEVTEKVIIGPAKASEVLNGTYALADDNENMLGGNPGDPVTGADTHFVGKAWCYGELALDPVPQDGSDEFGPDQERDGNPASAGVTCNGTLVDDSTQTDKLEATLTFRAEQWRNNEGFTCQD